MSRDVNDPRIANVLARFDDWQSVEGIPETQAVAESARYVEHQLLGVVDWEGFTIKELRAIVLAIASVADDALLDAWDGQAEEERRVFLECTVGNEITDAIEKCGVKNGFRAEQIAHRAIAEALKLVREQRQPTTDEQPEAQ